MSFTPIAILLLSLTGVTRAEVPAELPSRAEFCTGAGPIELEFRGEQVSGKYRILIPGKDLRGEMSLRWSHGFLEGEWIDEDGRGPIVIVLHDRGERMTALYARHDKPTQWEASWTGWRPGSRPTEDPDDCP